MKTLGFWSLLGMIVATGLQAYSGGPPNGYAGDPPAMNNCTACHGTFPVNSGDGTLAIVGLPEVYQPGSTYTFQVTLEDPGQSRWGFELTVIDEAGNQAGTLEAVDGTVQISEGPGTQRDYAKQTLSGTFPGQTSATWTLRWTAPAAGAGVATFYVAGNAANGNGSVSGDYVYTLNTAVVAVAEGEASEIQGSTQPHVVPNPLTSPQPLRIQGVPGAPPHALVLDSAGRLVSLLPLQTLGTGDLQGQWTGRDLHHRPLHPGTYWLHLRSPSSTVVLPLLWLP